MDSVWNQNTKKLFTIILMQKEKWMYRLLLEIFFWEPKKIKLSRENINKKKSGLTVVAEVIKVVRESKVSAKFMKFSSSPLKTEYIWGILGLVISI